MKGLMLLLSICVFGAFAQTLVLTESFSTGIPVNWTVIDNDNNTVEAAVSEYTEAWISKEDPDNSNNTVASSTSFFNPIDRADRWLITPAVDLGIFGNTISWKTKSHDPSFPEDYSVLISTTDNQITSFTDTVILVEDAAPSWTDYSVNLSELGYNGGTVYIAFVLTTFDGFKLYLDDVEINKEDPVSTDDIEVSPYEIVVYPNPTTASFTVESSQNLGLSISTLDGKKLIEAKTNVNVDISSFESGVYFIHIQTEKGRLTKRIVKK